MPLITRIAEPAKDRHLARSRLRAHIKTFRRLGEMGLEPRLDLADRDHLVLRHETPIDVELPEVVEHEASGCSGFHHVLLRLVHRHLGDAAARQLRRMPRLALGRPTGDIQRLHRQRQDLGEGRDVEIEGNRLFGARKRTRANAQGQEGAQDAFHAAHD